MTPLSSPPPPPTLPLEIKHEILQFCDAPTLGRTSQVSLAFLQLSSPLLYRDVFIEGIETLEKLFCTRVDFQNPQIPSSLNYIKTFTFSEPRLSTLPPSSLVLAQKLNDLAPILQIDRLSLFLPFVPHALDLPPLHQLVEHLLSKYLLPRIAPVEVHVEGVPHRGEVAGQLDSTVLLKVHNAPSLSFDSGCWTNLTSISFKDATTSSPLRDQPFKNIVLVTEFSGNLSFEARWFMVNSTLDDLFGSGTEEEGSVEALPGQGIERVEIWVDSQRRKEELSGILREEAFASVDELAVEGRLSRIEVNVRA